MSDEYYDEPPGMLDRRKENAARYYESSLQDIVFYRNHLKDFGDVLSAILDEDQAKSINEAYLDGGININLPHFYTLVGKDEIQAIIERRIGDIDFSDKDVQKNIMSVSRMSIEIIRVFPDLYPKEFSAIGFENFEN